MTAIRPCAWLWFVFVTLCLPLKHDTIYHFSTCALETFLSAHGWLVVGAFRGQAFYSVLCRSCDAADGKGMDTGLRLFVLGSSLLIYTPSHSKTGRRRCQSVRSLQSGRRQERQEGRLSEPSAHTRVLALSVVGRRAGLQAARRGAYTCPRQTANTCVDGSPLHDG